MNYLLRVQLPDEPGSLGAVATALGEAGADITTLDVVERVDGVAVDDLIVELAPPAMADVLLSAAHSVPGVVVESLRPYHAARDIHRELDLVDAMAADPADAVSLLVRSAPEVFRAGWAMLLERVPEAGESSAGAKAAGGQPGEARVLHRSSAAPEGSVATPWLPLASARRLTTGDWAPQRWHDLAMKLAAAPLGSPDVAVLIGRPGGPGFRASEIVRLAHLAGIAATVASVAAMTAGDRETASR